MSEEKKLGKRFSPLLSKVGYLCTRHQRKAGRIASGFCSRKGKGPLRRHIAYNVCKESNIAVG